MKVKVIKMQTHAPRFRCSNAGSAMNQMPYHITLSFAIKLNIALLNLIILMVEVVVEIIVEMAAGEVVLMVDPFVEEEDITTIAF